MVAVAAAAADRGKSLRYAPPHGAPVIFTCTKHRGGGSRDLRNYTKRAATGDVVYYRCTDDGSQDDVTRKRTKLNMAFRVRNTPLSMCVYIFRVSMYNFFHRRLPSPPPCADQRKCPTPFRWRRTHASYAARSCFIIMVVTAAVWAGEERKID